MQQPSLYTQSAIPLCSPRPDADLCFNRHGGVETSVLAHARVRKEHDRQLVYGYIKAAGAFGMTLDELSIMLDRPPNCLSGRFSELKRSGEIVASDKKRQTRTQSWARVYVAA